MNIRSLLIAAVSCLLAGCAEDPVDFEATAGSAGTSQAGSAGQCSLAGAGGSTSKECDVGYMLECSCGNASGIKRCGSDGKFGECVCANAGTSGAGGSPATGGSGGNANGGSGGQQINQGGSSGQGGTSQGGSSSGGSSQGGSSTGGSSTGGSSTGGSSTGGSGGSSTGGAGGSSGQGGTSQGGSGGSPQYYYYYVDADGDGWGAGNPMPSTSPTPPAGDSAKSGDCDDNNADIHPGAIETCNQDDDDCDGQIDEGFQKYVYYRDADGDGYGKNLTETACSQPAGYVTNNMDCDDTSASRYPNAPELCDGLDNDCDNQTDEGCTVSDNDHDGYTVAQGDCNDNNSSIHPYATEICGNNVDDDCDGQTDEGCTVSQDHDGDGRTVAQGDCNDSDASVYGSYNSLTAAPELCDGKDNDCDGQTDEGCGTPSGTTKLVCYFKAADNQKHDYYAYNWIASTTPTVTYNSVWGKFEMDNPPEGSKLMFDTYRDPPSGNIWQNSGCQWDNPSHLNFEFACYIEKNGVKMPTSEVQGESNQQNGCREFLWVQASGTTDQDGDGFSLPHDCNDNGPFVHPGAEDPYGGPDENCNGSNNF